MSCKIQKRADVRTGFSAKDHLGIQPQIDRRACSLWLAVGLLGGNGPNDWLRAEREVLTEFCLVREKRFSVRSVSRPERKINATRSRLSKAILNARENFQAGKAIAETTITANSL